MMKILPSFFLFLATLPFLATGASGQIDDFNDGNDSGWTRIDPLGQAIASPFATFGIQDGGYRIQAATSPAPGAAGPARGASLRQDVVYQNRLFITVDLKVSDPAIKQAIGLLTFVQTNPSLGMISGYSLSYQPHSQDLVLNLIVDEAPVQLAIADLNGVAGDTVRLIFTAENGLITGTLFSAEDLNNPIALVTATDTTFTSGTAGVFVFADTNDDTGPVDATFDNYRANALIGPPLAILITDEGDYQLTWPAWAVQYSLTTRIDLQSLPWREIPESEFLKIDDQFIYTVDPTEVPGAFFRLERR